MMLASIAERKQFRSFSAAKVAQKHETKEEGAKFLPCFLEMSIENSIFVAK